MEKTAVGGIEHSPHPRDVTDVRRLLGPALGTDHLDLTHYELAPGDRFSGACHRHLEREEVFLTLAGTATFETEAGPVEITAGEAVRFGPGEWQLGHNEGPEPVEALLVGTPKALAPVEAYLDCPDCERETRFRVEPQPQEGGEAMEETRQCLDCGGVFEL